MNNEQNLTSGQNNAQVSRDKPKEEYHVVLPCEVKDFRNFVAGLLGKPQEIRSEIEGTFQISHQEISNICHLITQRVDRQNEASLVHLGITVYYKDGNSVTHHNVNDFETYYPTSPSYPVGISIDFTYLIKFQNGKIPEKQEINVSIETNPEFSGTRVNRWFRSGLFSFRILHTERTWASDISGLLKSHAESIINKRSSVAKFLSENEDGITVYLSLIVFTAVVIFWCINSLSMLENPQVYFPNYTSVSISKYWVVSVTVFSVLAAVLYSIKYFFQYQTLQTSSMIVLIDKDQERQRKAGKAYIMKWGFYLIGWLMNIVSGIVSTYAYTHIT